MDRALHELSKFLVPEESVKRHARAIENCVCRALQSYSASEQALFKVDRVGVYGSTGRGTSIAMGADMDAYVFVRPVPLASTRPTSPTDSTGSSSSASSASTTSTDSTLTSSTTTLVLPASGSVSGSGSPADKPSTRDSNSKVTAEKCATKCASPEADVLSAEDTAGGRERERNVSGSSSCEEPRTKERRTNNGSKSSRRHERCKPAPEEKEKANVNATDERESACGKDKNADSARVPSNSSAGAEEATERANMPTNASATGEAAVAAAAPAVARNRGARAAAAFALSDLPTFDDISREILRVLREAPELKNLDVRLDLSKANLAELTCLYDTWSLYSM